MSDSPARLFRGLFESHLHVADLERAMAFYGDVLGLQPGFTDMERRAALYWVGADKKSMLGVWEKPPWAQGKSATLPTPQHIAFQISLEDLTTAIQRVKQRGLQLTNFFGAVTDEPSVFAWMPAASIYFNDPDGHSLELIALLAEEPAPEIGVVSLTEWNTLQSSRP
ncbi:MAG TPA: VOC family protein [Candidatus Limnocylindrales bacterium]|jgi:predicted enzyme related to lactoylglutathione lyase|nr:VOC family protein [Candidatus Limnocylindrales bacterium]